MANSHTTTRSQDDIPITAMELERGKNAHVPAPIQKYANFVSEKPRICLFLSVIFMLGMSAIGFIVREDLPDFAKADKGFDARGTDLAAALRTTTHFDAQTYKFDDNGVSDDMICNGESERKRETSIYHCSNVPVAFSS